MWSMSWLSFGHFNPRSLTGATSLACNLYTSTSDISIHAPSRERQYNVRRSKNHHKDFNPRSLTGATFTLEKSKIIIRFQSTLPHGSDLITTRAFCWKLSISIHAPSRERRFKPFRRAILSRFQSTLPHGSDHVRPFLKGVVLIFQSTLPHGSDVILLLM